MSEEEYGAAMLKPCFGAYLVPSQERGDKNVHFASRNGSHKPEKLK